MSDVQAFNYGVISSVISQLGKGVELPAKGFQFVVQGAGGVNKEYWTLRNTPIYTVDWGDGTKSRMEETPTYSDIKHMYASDGEYTITITENGEDAHITANDTWLEVLTPPLRGLLLLPTHPYDGPFFFRSKNLRKICGKVFKYHTDIISLHSAFSETSLYEVPDDLLEGCSEVLSISHIFYKSALQHLPVGIFNSLTKCQAIDQAFYGCSSLETISWDLFNSMSGNLHDYSGVFYNCGALTGAAPPWWRIEGLENNGGACFYNCKKLDNYERIPPWWGGGASGVPGSYD